MCHFSRPGISHMNDVISYICSENLFMINGPVLNHI